jgi:hypothetical protein
LNTLDIKETLEPVALVAWVVLITSTAVRPGENGDKLALSNIAIAPLLYQPAPCPLSRNELTAPLCCSHAVVSWLPL